MPSCKKPTDLLYKNLVKPLTGSELAFIRVLRLQMSLEDFGHLRKTSDFFRKLWTSSGIFRNDCAVFKNPSTPWIKISCLYVRKSWQVYISNIFKSCFVIVLFCVLNAVRARGLESHQNGVAWQWSRRALTTTWFFVWCFDHQCLEYNHLYHQ